ncbi:inositol monophosphatase [uncultured Jannaschia sp.]|uniref:inositol monophosphatase family protein n=1 Tax=uncultured Jannaschia sp. TaxID=293347 RepID=UPI00260DC96B|nr:inositol monophosphatase [uncultured Jannaschia sp.]
MTDDRPDYAALEALAAELAHLAGAEIEASLGRTLRVAYKGEEGQTRDPVSEVDHAVETLIRARLGEIHPDHDIVGEEFPERPNAGHPIIWAVDPVDGTANFVNGLPLFAASVGVLHDGAPVAGAVWCSNGHALRHGVYSACLGGELRFDGTPLTPVSRPQVRRALVGMPRTDGWEPRWFDARKTGSAAIECAFVAAGLLAGARFETPNLWDVAGGAALVRAAGGQLREHRDGAWRDLGSFGAEDGDDAGAWRAPMVLGTPDAVAALEGWTP